MNSFEVIIFTSIEVIDTISNLNKISFKDYCGISEDVPYHQSVYYLVPSMDEQGANNLNLTCCFQMFSNNQGSSSISMLQVYAYI